MKITSAAICNFFISPIYEHFSYSFYGLCFYNHNFFNLIFYRVFHKQVYAKVQTFLWKLN